MSDKSLDRLLKNIAYQLSLMGLVTSERDFSEGWLGGGEWTEKCSLPISPAVLETLHSSLILQEIAYTHQWRQAKTASTRWIARNRMNTMKAMRRAVATRVGSRHSNWPKAGQR